MWEEANSAKNTSPVQPPEKTTLSQPEQTRSATVPQQTHSMPTPVVTRSMSSQPVRCTPCRAPCSTGSNAKYTREEIKQHNSATDCWIIVKKKVYDVTAFLDTHPAGAKAILRYAGTDCTYHYQFHSAEAQKVFARYVIGGIEGEKECAIM